MSLSFVQTTDNGVEWTSPVPTATTLPPIHQNDSALGLLFILCSCKQTDCTLCDQPKKNPAHILLLIAVYKERDQLNRTVPSHAVVTPLHPTQGNPQFNHIAMTNMQFIMNQSVMNQRENPDDNEGLDSVIIPQVMKDRERRYKIRRVGNR